MSNKYYVGGDITSFSDNGKYKPISRVTLLVDDENSLTAGDDTGMEIVASCPHATQDMVNALLQTMKGYQYQAYEAGAANIDPAAELGDGVTVAGVYSPLSKISDDGRGYAGISSPGEAEMEDEYPSEGYITQEFNRKIAETRSIITKTSESITLRVDGLDSKYTALQVTVDGLTVTDASGTTKIKGSSIETSTLKVSAANITGTLTIGQLPSGVAMDDDIPTKLSELTNDSGYQTATGVTTIIGGTVTADYVNALGIEAVSLIGNTIGIKYRYLDGNLQIHEGLSGHLTTYDTTSGPGLGMVSESGLKLLAGSGSNVFLASNGGNSGPFITLDYVNGNVHLGGGRLVIGSQMFGDSAPTGTGEYGQAYFQLVS